MTHVNGIDGGDCLLFAASSESEREKWIRAISKAIHSNNNNDKNTTCTDGGATNVRRHQQHQTSIQDSTSPTKLSASAVGKRKSAASAAFDLHLNNILSKNIPTTSTTTISTETKQAATPFQATLSSMTNVLQTSKPIIPRGQRRKPGKSRKPGKKEQHIQ